ncbi:hypothetical protein F5Y16DRAFT_46057 [Xylariaceae sp. FL0255]|nr:hypothetical protein F5Y16DRAFT_46057 [Xylariaceae sp. FL0255]
MKRLCHARRLSVAGHPRQFSDTSRSSYYRNTVYHPRLDAKEYNQMLRDDPDGPASEFFQFKYGVMTNKSEYAATQDEKLYRHPDPKPKPQQYKPSQKTKRHNDQPAFFAGDKQAYNYVQEQFERPRNLQTDNNRPAPSTTFSSDDSRASSSNLFSDRVKDAFAKIHQSAVVITTLDRTFRAQSLARVETCDMRPPIARGMTIASLASLSAHPALLTFNITVPSTFYSALQTCEDFNVHILSPDQDGVRLAVLFRSGNRVNADTKNKNFSEEYGAFQALKPKPWEKTTIRQPFFGNADVWRTQFKEALRKGQETERKGKVAYQRYEVPEIYGPGVVTTLKCTMVQAITPKVGNNKVIIIGQVLFEKKNDRYLDLPTSLGWAGREYTASTPLPREPLAYNEPGPSSPNDRSAVTGYSGEEREERFHSPSRYVGRTLRDKVIEEVEAEEEEEIVATDEDYTDVERVHREERKRNNPFF